MYLKDYVNRHEGITYGEAMVDENVRKKKYCRYMKNEYPKIYKYSKSRGEEKETKLKSKCPLLARHMYGKLNKQTKLLSFLIK